MDINNPLYKNQGIHANIVLLTCDEGELKVLLVKRTNNPFIGLWSLPGGAVYNNETVDSAAIRELKEKTGIENIDPKMFGVFSDINRAPQMRMVCVAYISVIDKSAINFVKQTSKTDDADWFCLDKIPENLAYDHNKIVEEAFNYLKEQLWKDTKLIKRVFPDGATMPELHKFYSKILGENLDRRNFRKKMIADGLVVPTEEIKQTKGKKASIVYLIK